VRVGGCLTLDPAGEASQRSCDDELRLFEFGLGARPLRRLSKRQTLTGKRRLAVATA